MQRETPVRNERKPADPDDANLRPHVRGRAGVSRQSHIAGGAWLGARFNAGSSGFVHPHALRRSGLRLEEMAVIGVLLFFGIAGAVPGIAPNQANEMTGAAATHLQAVVGIGAQILVNGVIAALLVRHWRVLVCARVQLGWAAALALWAISSTCWSEAPWMTARRVVPFAMATLFGMVLALRYPERRLLRLLLITFAVLACGSAVVALGFPSIGLDASTGHGGDWQGVFTQKNACGRAMVFALAALLAAGQVRLKYVGLLLVFGAELGLSGSRGAWLLGALVGGVLLLFRATCYLDRHTRAVALLVLGGLATGVAALAAANFGEIAAMLGRDPTLTGRTAIWHEVWIAIQQRPVFGYGFSAFWQGAGGASWQVVVALKFVLFHAHNGFLEIWLELGGVGLLLFAASFVRAAALLWPEIEAGRFETAAWPSTVLLLIALYDIDENTLLSFNGLYWVLYTGALVRVEVLALGRQERRREARAARWRPAMADHGRPEHSEEPGRATGQPLRSPWIGGAYPAREQGGGPPAPGRQEGAAARATWL